MQAKVPARRANLIGLRMIVADGLGNPVGKLTWRVVSDPLRLDCFLAVNEEVVKVAALLHSFKAKLSVERSAEGCL